MLNFIDYCIYDSISSQVCFSEYRLVPASCSDHCQAPGFRARFHLCHAYWEIWVMVVCCVRIGRKERLRPVEWCPDAGADRSKIIHFTP